MTSGGRIFQIRALPSSDAVRTRLPSPAKTADEAIVKIRAFLDCRYLVWLKAVKIDHVGAGCEQSIDSAGTRTFADDWGSAAGIGWIAKDNGECLVVLGELGADNGNADSRCRLARGKSKRAIFGRVIAASFCSSVLCPVMYSHCIVWFRPSQSHYKLGLLGSIGGFVNRGSVSDSDCRRSVSGD